MSWTTPITRALNKEFKGALPEGLRVQASAFGSFLSIRIDDAEGKVSVKLADQIVRRAADLFFKAGAMPSIIPSNGVNYHMGGIVANWLRH